LITIYIASNIQNLIIAQQKCSALSIGGVKMGCGMKSSELEQCHGIVKPWLYEECHDDFSRDAEMNCV